jgi:hypothetical protein
LLGRVVTERHKLFHFILGVAYCAAIAIWQCGTFYSALPRNLSTSQIRRAPANPEGVGDASL